MTGESSLFAAAQACLRAGDPDHKRALTHAIAADFAAGRLTLDDTTPPSAIADPGRPARPLLVDPRQLPRRGLGSVAGRAALIHAVAHIEFNAINLAWDAVYRFRGMPAAYYRDWVMVADDEARHFGMVCARLAELGYGYGDFDVHNGLWDMAVRTADSCVARMALVPRVLEARGLDVTPGMIERLRAVGDVATVAVLDVILADEVAHVRAGTRWFHWCCEQAGIEPDATFDQLLAEHLNAVLKGPFNIDARLSAGFSRGELDRLIGAAA